MRIFLSQIESTIHLKNKQYLTRDCLMDNLILRIYYSNLIHEKQMSPPTLNSECQETKVEANLENRILKIVFRNEF